jgi:hypothetical protein
LIDVYKMFHVGGLAEIGHFGENILPRKFCRYTRAGKDEPEAPVTLTAWRWV